MTPQEQQEFIQGIDRLGFKIVGALGRIFGSLAARDEETYWYAIQSSGGSGFVDLTAVIGNQNTATIQITQEADFVGTRFLAESINPATGVILTNPSWNVLVTDSGSDRQLMNQPIHVTDIGGTAQRSVPFTKNRLFRRNSTISLTFTNLQAVATRIWFVAQGYKIYDEASLDLVRRR